MKIRLILSFLITCNLAIVGAQPPEKKICILVKNSEGDFEPASLQTAAFTVAFLAHQNKVEELRSLRDSSLAELVEPDLVNQLNQRISFLENQPKK